MRSSGGWGSFFFLRQKGGKTLHCRCFGFLIVCTGCHASHFHLTDCFPLRILKLRSHREASTSQGIGPRPGEEAIWLLFICPPPWQPSGGVLFAPVRESFFLDNPPLFWYILIGRAFCRQQGRKVICCAYRLKVRPFSCKQPLWKLVRHDSGLGFLSQGGEFPIDINICSCYNYNTAFEKKDCLC